MNESYFYVASLLKRLVSCLLCAILFLSTAYADNGPGFGPIKPVRPSSSARKLHNRYKPFSPDPLLFRLVSNVSNPRVGQEIELQLSVQFVTVASGSMFFSPGSNAYSLKVIIPTNFSVTGGDNIDYVQNELSDDKPNATYTIRGHFTSQIHRAYFAVLRGAKDANNASLFELRHELYLSATAADAQARLGGTSCPGTGSLSYERWNNIAGTSIAELLSKTNN
ncbi:hypothetical protein J2I47_06830, partial [Fibrella sp. HMF5335]